MCGKPVTSCGMTRTSHCALHLRSRAEHMNNTNAHTTLHNPYDIASVRSYLFGQKIFLLPRSFWSFSAVPKVISGSCTKCSTNIQKPVPVFREMRMCVSAHSGRIACCDDEPSIHCGPLVSVCVSISATQISYPASTRRVRVALPYLPTTTKMIVPQVSPAAKRKFIAWVVPPFWSFFSLDLFACCVVLSQERISFGLARIQTSI